MELAPSALKAEILSSEITGVAVQYRSMARRVTRPTGEAVEFQKRFEEIVRARRPDYERNKLVRGIRLEYLRELLPGVFASHNVLCKKGTYYHGFCITLHRELSDPYLISPFVVGGRFDHNNSTKTAFFRDVELNRKSPFGGVTFSDSHSYRKGWDSIVDKCTRVAEDQLLPHYFAQLRQYKAPLLHLVERLLELGEIPIEIDRGSGYLPCTLFPIDYDMKSFVEGYRAAGGRRRDQFALDIIHSKPELFNRIRQMKTLPDLLTTLRS